MSYAIISVGGKQYRVREGERLLVDRLKHGVGDTFQPPVLLIGGGDGGTQIAPKNATVTVRVVSDELGKKIRIGKYKAKVGYKKHTGFRASLTQIEIESIGAPGAKAAAKPKAQDVSAKPKAEAPAKAAAADADVKGMPSGYEELTVAAIKEQSDGWNQPTLAAAHAYERAHGKRKGALAVLESAIAEKESS